MTCVVSLLQLQEQTRRRLQIIMTFWTHHLGCHGKVEEACPLSSAIVSSKVSVWSITIVGDSIINELPADKLF